MCISHEKKTLLGAVLLCPSCYRLTLEGRVDGVVDGVVEQEHCVIS